MDKIVPTQFIVELFGISYTTLTQWVRRGLPKVERGKYNLKDVIDWYIQREIERAIAKLPKITEDDEQSPRDRKDLALAAWHELKVEKERGSLIPHELAQQQLIEHFESARAALLAMPGANAHRVIGIDKLDEAQIRLQEIVYDTLEKMSQPIEYPDFSELVKLEDKLQNE